MRIVQIARRADDLARAAEFHPMLLGSPPTATYDPPGLLFFDLDGVRLLRGQFVSEPHQWQGFVNDSEGDLVGLVEQRARAS